jgi:hypothetical protein
VFLGAPSVRWAKASRARTEVIRGIARITIAEGDVG